MTLIDRVSVVVASFEVIGPRLRFATGTQAPDVEGEMESAGLGSGAPASQFSPQAAALASPHFAEMGSSGRLHEK